MSCMRRMTAAVLSATLIAVAAVAPVAAQTPRTITWEDLMPPGPPVADPFAHMSMDIVAKLYEIIGAREQKQLGNISDVSPAYERSVEATHELKRMGVPVEDLIRQYWAAEKEIERQERLIVPELDGQFVRIPGYALPLESVGVAVTEILLVPYVGACIHVPPPPPNQMVFVKLKEPYVPTDMFSPVWITGRISAKTTTNAVFISDGKAPVESGYEIDQAGLAPYKE